MAELSRYKTRQREELISYLQSIQGTHVTANDIREHFLGLGVTMGMATIYRNLDQLVEEGTVKRYLFDKAGAAVFEYVGRGEYCRQPICFHLKCERCGKLIHLKCRTLEALQSHMLVQHGFELDSLRTVFYGVCEQCAGMKRGQRDE